MSLPMLKGLELDGLEGPFQLKPVYDYELIKTAV